MKGTGVALATGLAVKAAEYPLRGRVQRDVVRCYVPGRGWQELHPTRYEVIVLGVDAEQAEKNYNRNRRVDRDGLPDWVTTGAKRRREHKNLE